MREREREYSKQSLSKFKKTEVISSIFSNHNAMRLEINYKEKHKHIDTKLYASKQPMDHWRNPRGNKKDKGTNKNENTMIHNLWDIAKSLLILKRKFIVIQGYLGKQEKSQMNDVTLHLK